MLSTKGSRYDLKRQSKRTGIPLIKDEMRGNLLDYVFRSQKKLISSAPDVVRLKPYGILMFKTSLK